MGLQMNSRSFGHLPKTTPDSLANSWNVRKTTRCSCKEKSFKKWNTELNPLSLKWLLLWLVGTLYNTADNREPDHVNEGKGEEHLAEKRRVPSSCSIAHRCWDSVMLLCCWSYRYRESDKLLSFHHILVEQKMKKLSNSEALEGNWVIFWGKTTYLITH